MICLFNKIYLQVVNKQAHKKIKMGFTLNADKTYSFGTASFYAPSNKTNFYEVMETIARAIHYSN